MAEFSYVRKMTESALKEKEFDVKLELTTSTGRKKTYSGKEVLEILSKDVRAKVATLVLSKRLDDETSEKISFFEEYYHPLSLVYLKHAIEKGKGENSYEARWSYVKPNFVEVFYEGKGRPVTLSYGLDYRVPLIWSYVKDKHFIMTPRTFKELLRQYTGFEDYHDLFLETIRSESASEVRNLLASLTEMSKMVPVYVELKSKNEVERELLHLLGEISAQVVGSQRLFKDPQAIGDEFVLVLFVSEATLLVERKDHKFSWKGNEKEVEKKVEKVKKAEEADQLMTYYYEEFLQDFLKTLREKVQAQLSRRVVR